MRAVVEYPRGWAAVVVVMVIGASRPAIAQSVQLQGDASANVGYTQVTRGTAQVDPTADAADRPASSTSQLFTELRPGISLQTGSPRVTWRAGYVFSGNLSLTGGPLATYANAANAAMAAELSQGSLLTVSAAASQGGTSFLLSQRAADAGQPELRAPGNPNLISGTLVESLSWQLLRHLAIQHTLIGSVSAPQDALDQRNSALTATLALESPQTRDVFGLEVHASVSWLRPLQAEQRPYKTLDERPARPLEPRLHVELERPGHGGRRAGLHRRRQPPAGDPAQRQREPALHARRRGRRARFQPRHRLEPPGRLGVAHR